MIELVPATISVTFQTITNKLRYSKTTRLSRYLKFGPCPIVISSSKPFQLLGPLKISSTICYCQAMNYRMPSGKSR